MHDHAREVHATHDHATEDAALPVTVDCERCVARGPTACADCVVTVLLGGPPHGVRIDPEEQTALDTLAAAGLIPPLRLVRPA